MAGQRRGLSAWAEARPVGVGITAESRDAVMVLGLLFFLFFFSSFSFEPVLSSSLSLFLSFDCSFGRALVEMIWDRRRCFEHGDGNTGTEGLPWLSFEMDLDEGEIGSELLCGFVK
jgi:hypothetical protein